MKIIYLTFILSCLYLFSSECIAKKNVVYEYESAGNRTIRYIDEFTTAYGLPQEDNVVSLGELDVDIYPNPTNGPIAIDITGETDQPMLVEVFSNAGASLQSKSVTVGKNRVDLTTYPDGQYILILTSGAKYSTSFKVVKGNF